MAPVIRREYSSRVHAKKYYTSYKWNLEEYSTLQGYYGDFIESPEFELAQSDKKCSIGFQHCDDEIAYARIYFPQGVKFHSLKIVVSIIDEYDRKIISRYSIANKPLEVDEMTSYTTFEHALLPAPDIFKRKGCLHNDTLTLLCEITLIKNVIKSPLETTDLTRCLDDTIRDKFHVYFMNTTLCDVKFSIDDTELRAHKVILAAHSPVFEAMFSTEMSEQLKNTVTITDTDATIFEAFLKCMYTGSIAKMEKYIGNLLILSDKYQVADMRNLCEDYIKNHLDSTNAIEYLLLAHLHGFDNLKRRALLVATLYQKELAESADFSKLCNYPDLVAEMFRKVIE